MSLLPSLPPSPLLHPFSHSEVSDALVQHLCCFLEAASVMAGFGCTNRRLSSLVSSPLSKRVLRMCLSHEKQAPALFERVMPAMRLARLESLDLSIPDRSRLLELPITEAYMRALIEGCPRLQHLQLACVRLHHTSIAALVSLPALTSLSLDFTPTSAAGLCGPSVQLDHHYYSALFQLVNLRHLRFVCSWNGRDSFLARFSALTNLESLELRFKSAELSLPTIEAWSASLKCLRSLVLHKMSPMAGSELALDVFEPLAELPMLTRLDLPHSVSSLSMFASLTQLRSLSILIAENHARGTNSTIAALKQLHCLTHLSLVNQEAQADALMQQLRLHAPPTLTSLQLSLDSSLTRVGCSALEEMRPLRFLTLLNAVLTLDPSADAEPSASDDQVLLQSRHCSSARFIGQLEYLHVSAIKVLEPVHAPPVKPLSSALWSIAPTSLVDRDGLAQFEALCRAQPYRFVGEHAQRLEVLRVDEGSDLSLLPLVGCASLRVLGDSVPTLYGYGNRAGTRSNLLRHAWITPELHDWIVAHRTPLWKAEWHRSAAVTPTAAYSPDCTTLPAWSPADRLEFFRRLAASVIQAHAH